MRLQSWEEEGGKEWCVGGVGEMMEREERRGSYHVIGFQAVVAVLTVSQATGAPVRATGSSPGEVESCTG